MVEALGDFFQRTLCNELSNSVVRENQITNQILSAIDLAWFQFLFHVFFASVHGVLLLSLRAMKSRA
ncbi:hypothetical protein AZ34_08050 [Hylemonella gracilis str. Niagara R]|uniref:Uncharacterized protein n=1 Tax=Hylemonella gracilis str. Niagara R TaxID=1458275 RepID=A0A016XL49_9BURK|nr:hypothetical protein AZ34_08050 [Hylemonella gracilis str. Niagara R]